MQETEYNMDFGSKLKALFLLVLCKSPVTSEAEG